MMPLEFSVIFDENSRFHIFIWESTLSGEFIPTVQSSKGLLCCVGVLSPRLILRSAIYHRWWRLWTSWHLKVSTW
ncbi:unnamed protein product [Blepharisma stoltei]|uniref:Uncharacterized protein n=1 Tax=Blepharisma stoltei TaxID=1481888 RepID=A0AAU9KAL3_9CILI|nr:unnamed protein product [Blepharisma stoltei]